MEADDEVSFRVSHKGKGGGAKKVARYNTVGS